MTPTSNHNLRPSYTGDGHVVYLLTPTSNHNRYHKRNCNRYVVYLLTPTSNHNSISSCSTSLSLYIFWLLHQTTTVGVSCPANVRCISFDSYIKPQPSSKPAFSIAVVYLLTPTSNHNSSWVMVQESQLYIFWLLHQTTTVSLQSQQLTRCISFDSYIKPQRSSIHLCIWIVVYLLTPTSNHNAAVLIIILALLYIFWLLHQTTTPMLMHLDILSCISFDSYIKPQLYYEYSKL